MSQAQRDPLETRVLLLGPTARDAAMTRRILGAMTVACESCDSVSKFCAELRRGAGAVILTEEMVETQAIGEFVEHLRQQPPWSDLPILLLARGGASSPAGLRAMDLLGNVTVLERPVQTASLVSVVRTLLRGREWQYQIRRYMHELEEAATERERLLNSEQAARSEAERTSRVKDEFLATLSHELRTPLNAILGWSQLLRIGKGSESELQEGLSTIERNARVQTQIIEDLLDMSRIISGRIRLDVQRIDLINVINAAIDTCKPAADAKQIRLHSVLDPAAGIISGDPSRLQQVFWNLISNAIKFTPRGGKVQVVLQRVNSHIEVAVIDSGEGIKAEFLPHVFDRFRQADPSTTRRHGGLGLGLAIVKTLVELHGGSITAASPGLGQGSTFTVSLPITVIHADQPEEPRRRHPTAITSPTKPLPSITLKGVKVLVVDDEPDARALVKRLLEDCDATVSTASSAEEAIEFFRTSPPNVLISDIGMPGEDGYSLIRKIRALDRTRGQATPALALTAYARSEDRMQAIRNGYHMHIAKPVEPAELTTVVAALAGRTNLLPNSPDDSQDPAVTM